LPFQFFALPVDDLFAPGYSEIIHHPMDFSTMRNNLAAGKYSTLAAFRFDFELVQTILNGCYDQVGQISLLLSTF
jgi:bromodomain-containing protein 7/9